MTRSSITTPERAHADPSPALTGPILAATDGTSASEPALAAAEMLAGHSGRAVHVIAAVEPLPTAPVTALAGMAPHGSEDERRAELLTRVERQLTTMDPRGREWKLEVRAGRPSEVIAEAAHEQHASVVITGVRRHDPLDRWLGGETPIEAAALVDVPLLATTGLGRRPRTIVVATDFGAASLQAARTALALFPEVATVFLAHVEAPHLAAAWGEGYQRAAALAFEQTIAALGARRGVDVRGVPLSGSRAPAIMEFAEDARADVVVAGRRHRERLAWLVPGRTSARLLRGLAGSRVPAVLIVPERVAPDEGAAAPARGS